MVGFSVKAKWKSGWRRLKSEDQAAKEDAAFILYWARIHAQLAGGGVDRPLGRPAPSASADAFYRALLARHGPFVMAPMVVLSERAFRILCRRHGVGLCFAPMATEQRVLMDDCPYTEELLVPCEADQPLVGQVAGADPQRVLAAAQRMASGGNLCGVDLNLGCPQACARDANYGVFLAQRDPDMAVAIVRLLAAELGLPVSAKMRVVGGVEKTVEFAKRLEEAGASLLTLHGRKPEQRDHSGPSDFDAVKAVREAVRIPVLLNGNCRTRRDAEAALAYTGADGVMAAVGLLRNPRLFADVEEEGMRLSVSGTLANPAVAFEIAFEYLQLTSEYPPPEFRCIRDHLQTLLQGLLQFELPAVWSLLGNDYCTDVTQYRELLRLAASHYGVLEAVEAAAGVDAAERARPVMGMAEIKRMYKLPDEEAEEEYLAACGGMFASWEDEEEVQEEAQSLPAPSHENGIDQPTSLPEYALEVQVPWSRRLLEGSKTIETRAYTLPAEVVGRPVLLVESPEGGGLAAHGLEAGRAVGVVVFGASRRYATREEWAADASRHGVDPSASPEAFGWTEKEAKWGWEVARVDAWPAEARRPWPLREEQRLHRSVFRLG